MDYATPIIAVIAMIFIAHMVCSFSLWRIFFVSLILQTIAINLSFLWIGFQGRRSGNKFLSHWGDRGILYEFFQWQIIISFGIALIVTFLLVAYVWQLKKGNV